MNKFALMTEDKRSNLPPDYKPIEGEDYIIDELGRLVFTSAYLLKRGYCCENGCRNCPYGFKKDGSENSGEGDTPI